MQFSTKPKAHCWKEKKNRKEFTMNKKNTENISKIKKKASIRTTDKGCSGQFELFITLSFVPLHRSSLYVMIAGDKSKNQQSVPQIISHESAKLCVAPMD